MVLNSLLAGLSRWRSASREGVKKPGKIYNIAITKLLHFVVTSWKQISVCTLLLVAMTTQNMECKMETVYPG